MYTRRRERTFGTHSRIEDGTRLTAALFDIPDRLTYCSLCRHFPKRLGHGAIYVCGDFRFADLTSPRRGVKVEPRCFTDDEVRTIITNASEPLSTIVAVTAVPGLRIGETLALRRSDVDFAKHLMGIRQSVDAATRMVGAVKSKASSADLPMSRELEARLRAHLQRQDGKSDLLFVNRRGRPFSANKLQEKQLHPLLDALKIPRGDSIRCGTVRLVPYSPTVRPRLSYSGNCGTLTHE
jgi:integrase